MANFCQLCGKPIRHGKTLHHSRWPTEQHLQVCLECYRHKPRCRVCGLPMASAPTGPAAELICATCAQYTPRCLTCGKVIVGRYFEINGAGPYCQRCHKERPPCDVCGAPVGEKVWQLSDGRLACDRCHATAVYTPEVGQEVYAEVMALVAGTLGLRLNIPTGLALVDRNQLMEIIRQQKGIGLDDPEHTLGIYARRGIRRGIYIQTGLPRLLLLQVAAHEYGHAWQGENCPLLNDLLEREGFAEWVAFKVLQARNEANRSRSARRSSRLRLPASSRFCWMARWLTATRTAEGNSTAPRNSTNCQRFAVRAMVNYTPPLPRTAARVARSVLASDSRGSVRMIGSTTQASPAGTLRVKEIASHST